MTQTMSHAQTTSRSVTLRPLELGEDERMARFFYRLSPETIYRRFMTHYSDPLPLRSLLDVDGYSRVAIVAVDTAGEIVGVARFSRLTTDPTTVEIAVVVQDDWQGRGTGQLLLTSLGDAARAVGVLHITGTLLASNGACLKVLTRSFPGLVILTEHGESTVYAEL